jgi:hypothetical protein
MTDMPLFPTDSGHVKVPLEATYQQTWSVMPTEMQEYVKTGIPPAVDDEA